MDILGLCCALLSSFCNGSFSVLSKLDSVQQAKVSPYLFNFNVSLGAALSALSLYFFTTVVFSPYGIASGLLFVLSTANSFLAIHLLDNVAVATGIWSGVSMCVSFCFGLISGESVRNMPLAIVALLIMLGGVAGVTFVYQSQPSMQQQETDEEQLVPQQGDHQDVRTMAMVGGFTAAGAAGLLGGLVLAPMKFAGVHGLGYVPSMGIGFLIASPLSLAMQLFWPSGVLSTPQWKAATPPGLLSGILWNVGNVLSIVATDKVGLSVAYPIMQSGLFIAGMWGIVLFDELKGQNVRLRYFGCGLVLLFGAILLSYVHE